VHATNGSVPVPRRGGRATKDFFKRRISDVFALGQHLGFDLLPRHFYSEIPDLRKLRASRWWRKELSMTQVKGADLDEQLHFARDVVTPLLSERLRRNDVYSAACAVNGAAGFGPAEADFLHCYVASMRPARIIQIGAGVSTAVALRAAAETGYWLQMTCIDPYPTMLLQQLAREGRIRLIDKPVQELDPAIGEELQAGDIFFTDSSHTLGPAGEVTRIVVEWLPRLKPGVRCHFHDIHFPYDYAPDTLSGSLFFQHETALLHAFLCMNGGYRILASLAMLHYRRQPELMAMLPNYRPCGNEDGLYSSPGHYPSSLFLERSAATAA